MKLDVGTFRSRAGTVSAVKYRNQLRYMFLMGGLSAICGFGSNLHSKNSTYTKEVIMAHAKYYSPRLDRVLITRLYFEAKARRIPMTVLANQLIEKGLSCGGMTGPAIKNESAGRESSEK